MAPEPRSSNDNASAGVGAPERARGVGPPGADAAHSGLLIDWGGVLTSSLFASFNAYCVGEQIDPQTLLPRFRTDPEARELLIALEKGELEETAFELLAGRPAGRSSPKA